MVTYLNKKGYAMVYSIVDLKELSLSLCSDSMGVHAHKARAVSDMTAYIPDANKRGNFNSTVCVA